MKKRSCTRHCWNNMVCEKKDVIIVDRRQDSNAHSGQAWTCGLFKVGLLSLLYQNEKNSKCNSFSISTKAKLKQSLFCNNLEEARTNSVATKRSRIKSCNYSYFDVGFLQTILGLNSVFRFVSHEFCFDKEFVIDWRSVNCRDSYKLRRLWSLSTWIRNILTINGTVKTLIHNVYIQNFPTNFTRVFSGFWPVDVACSLLFKCQFAAQNIISLIEICPVYTFVCPSTDDHKEDCRTPSLRVLLNKKGKKCLKTKIKNN